MGVALRSAAKVVDLRIAVSIPCATSLLDYADRQVDQLAQLASSDRAQSPLSSPPQPTPTSPGPTSSLLDFMKPSSLKRRRSNASMLNILTNASEAPPQFERAKTDAPQARKATPAYGSINKSLPPTPGKLAAAEANNPPPALPFSTNSIGINSGSLRKSAVIALKKSKGLLRTKGSKPADPSAPVPSSSYPYPADDRASIASSIEIPIQMPVGRQPESPYATNVSFPRGPGSASRSSSSIMPRASSESKRSASHPLESSFAIQPKARKSLELLRPGSDASSSSKAAATALAGPRPPQVQPPSATRDTSTREVKPPEPRSLPRQPSTDQLLMLATAKLQALVNAAQAAQSSNGSSRESFPTDAAAPSSDDASSVSSPGPAEETASVGKAVRVQRGSESPQSPKVMLVPSRSLKGSTVPPAEPIRPPPPSQQPTRNVTGPLVLPALATMPVTKEEPVAAAVQEEEGPMFEGPQWVAREIKFERKGSTSDVLAHPWDLLEAGLGEYAALIYVSSFLSC